MTEVNATKLQEAYTSANAKADKVVLMKNDPATSEDEIKAATKAAKEAVDRYNRLMEAEYYRTMSEKHGEKTVFELINLLYVQGVISISFPKGKDGKVIKEERPVKNRKVNLLHVREDIGAKFFHAEDWPNFLGRFSKLVANAVYTRLETGVVFNYPIEADAEAFGLPEDADPSSVTSMTRIGQAMVDKIVYIPETNKKGDTINQLKYEKKRWHAIRESFTSKGKTPGAVNIGSPELMCELFTDAIFNIIHGYENSVDIMGTR